MNYTTNYQLQKPLSTEKYTVSTFNMNADKLDSLISKIENHNKSQDDLLATKASLASHTDNNENPHQLTKAHVGLSNLTNDRQVKGIPSETTEDNFPIFGEDGYTLKDSGLAIQEINTLKSDCDTSYTHSQSPHAPANAEENTIIGIQKNGTDMDIDPSTRIVNITIPTKLSELENDSGFVSDSSGNSGNGITYSEEEPAEPADSMTWIDG